MAKSKLKEQLTRMRCGTCKKVNYHTRKNKKSVDRKLEFSKFCSWCREHTKHKEARK